MKRGVGGRGAEGLFVPSPIAFTSVLVRSLHVFDFRMTVDRLQAIDSENVETHN